jgi:hypothetical protein
MLETGSNFDWLSNITLSQIIISSMIVLLPSIILTHFNRTYSAKYEKNKYLYFLKNNSEPVYDFSNNIWMYKANTATRYIILCEGILIGTILPFKIFDYMVSISNIFVNTFLIKIFPYLILFTSQKYTNKIDFHVDSLLLASLFNYVSVIVVLFIWIWLTFLDSKKYSLPKLKKDMLLTKWSIFVYHSYWFLIGLLLGIDTFILLFTIDAILQFSSTDQNFSVSWTYFNNIFTNLKTQIPAKKGWYIIISYIIGFFLSITTIFSVVSLWIMVFPIYFNSLINHFYIAKFPYILIKTESGETMGQLYNFQHKLIIMLKENDVIKAIPWDQIKTMEVNNKEEKEEQPIKVLKNEAIHPR